MEGFEASTSGCKRRWVSHGFATPYSHHTARQHNFSMIAYACLRNLKELEVKLKPINVTLGCLRLAQRVMVFWTGADRTTTVEQIPHKLRKKQKQARFSCIFFKKACHGVSTSTARPECVNAKCSCRFKLAKSAAAPNAKTKPTSE